MLLFGVAVAWVVPLVVRAVVVGAIMITIPGLGSLVAPVEMPEEEEVDEMVEAGGNNNTIIIETVVVVVRVVEAIAETVLVVEEVDGVVMVEKDAETEDPSSVYRRRRQYLLLPGILTLCIHQQAHWNTDLKTRKRHHHHWPREQEWNGCLAEESLSLVKVEKRKAKS
jgi:hypothetical protein